ncbi:MAG TPA: preprotein translocase subunit SecA [Dehalococcoidia bacterium]|jgi:preprotein translocase subunit SecA|nr:preprotein translocase subunit SecA [Dehalococcoidia bacterium]
MLKWLGRLVDSNEKELKRLQPIVARINSLEPEFEKLSDAELRAKTDEFKARLKSGATLDELLPEAYAAVREAAKRTIGQRHFDVQLMGGIVLHQGKIAEMKTGEGKTLVATLPLYLNSLLGEGCHLVTVNDYLARRDPYWMGPIYHALGVSVASIYPQQTPDEHQPSRLYDPGYDSGDSRWRHFRPISRKEAYQADITYGTSSEFGFDYLRDNMVLDLSQCVQRPLNYAIVDEVDNLLIDEARTPLIISGPAAESGQIYQVFARLVPRLRPGVDYTVEEKERTVSLTDVGISNVEAMLRREGLLKSPNLYDPANYALTRYLDSALKAHALFKRDRDYVVKDGQVIIVDEFTGRLMFGRRYSEGLHQAIEAKEHVKVQQETMTFATITIQNYFRMYQKLAGMTGTAATEAEEFHKIYGLEVVVIPTHKPMIRQDFPDQIYKNEKAKFRAVVREIEELYKMGRPVLIGTVSIEKSERLSELLKRKGIPHQVLNAKYHEKEAAIIARAGEPGAVTVATNMAGRGVDIVLGGSLDGQNEQEWQEKHNKVVALGGLHIIGTERHEARRIDNQLRGRAGRQGDPGSSRFYVSLEDDIVRRFGGERIKGIMDWAGMDEDTPIENKLVSRAIENAQIRVEGFHFDMRKHLVEYDDVVNKHRELIYTERRKILGGADLKANILSMVREEISDMVASRILDEHGASWDIDGLLADISAIFPLPPTLNTETLSQMKPKEIEQELVKLAEALYEEREKEMGAENMRVLERLVMLRIIDSLWVEHLTAMEEMRQQAQWQTLRQTRAVDAYKREGYRQFQTLLDTIKHDVVRTIYRVSIVRQEAQAPAPSPVAQVASRGGSSRERPRVGGRKIGRNEPCPCGSGRKYKHCCGR